MLALSTSSSRPIENLNVDSYSKLSSNALIWSKQFDSKKINMDLIYRFNKLLV